MASTRSRFLGAIGEEEEATEGATRELREFDPRKAAKRSARAQFETFEEDLREDMQSLRGRQVGSGRVDTGFGFQDQDRFVRDRLDRLDRALATRATASAGQRLQQLGMVNRSRGRFFDLLSGQLDRETARENAEKQQLASILGGITGTAGSIIPLL